MNDRTAKYLNGVLEIGGCLEFNVGGEIVIFDSKQKGCFFDDNDGNLCAMRGNSSIRLTEMSGQLIRWSSLYISRPDAVDGSDQGW